MIYLLSAIFSRLSQSKRERALMSALTHALYERDRWRKRALDAEAKLYERRWS